MRKEEIRGLIIYALLIATAVIVALTVVRPIMDQYSPNMPQLLFFIIVIVVAYLVNAIGLELCHLFGALLGGYKITLFNILYLCFYKDGDKWKFGFRDFNGLTGETRIAPKKEKTNINWYTWFPLFGFAIELATCIVVRMLIVGAKEPAAPWLVPAAIITLLIASLLAFYNFVPLKLDTMTDGYRIRLFSNPANVVAYNEMLKLQEARRLGKNVEKIPVFSEITEYTAEINTIAIFEFLGAEKYKEANDIIDLLLENKKVLGLKEYQRLIAQKLYVSVLTQEMKDVKKLYEEICPVEIRRFIANDTELSTIRAYMIIAGMIEESESEVLFAKSKLEKAKRKANPSELKTEEVLVEKALELIYKSHPKWAKEKESTAE